VFGQKNALWALNPLVMLSPAAATDFSFCAATGV
jgi:hypothetical protein